MRKWGSSSDKVKSATNDLSDFRMNRSGLPLTAMKAEV